MKVCMHVTKLPLYTPFPPFSPSLISLVVSVDVKHHVYLLSGCMHVTKLGGVNESVYVFNKVGGCQ